MALAETPEAVLKRVFTVVERADTQISKQLPQLEADLTPELYAQLQAAYNKDPNSGEFLDFDPWSNSQMGFAGFSLGAAKIAGGQAKVPATIKVLEGGKSKYTCVLMPAADSWKLCLRFDESSSVGTPLCNSASFRFTGES